MEHNTEKIIREKINAAESTPLIWQKENVWLSIENNFETKHRMPLRYYVAASASLALGLFIFLLQPKSQITLLKSNALTKENTKTKIPLDHKSIISIEECKESGNTISSAKRNETVKSTLIFDDTITFQKMAVINTSKAETTELKALPVLPEKPINDTAVASHVEQVHAIFGVEEKSVVTLSAKRQKKVHFRLFKSEEESSPISNTSEPVNLLARINKN